MRTCPRRSGRARRRSVGTLLAAGAMAAGLLAAPIPAAAAEDEKSAEELAAEALDRLLRALDLLIGAIPQYEAPYVNENGDIIIRRKRDKGTEPLPTPEEKPPPPGDADTTTT